VEVVHDAVAGVHLPEKEEALPARAVPAGRRPEAPVVPLPNVWVVEIEGLLDILLHAGGEMDLFALDRITKYDFGRTIAVVKGAELLDFVDTPKQRVLLTDLGRRYVTTEPRGRRLILKRRLLTLGTFCAVVKFLAGTPDTPRRGEEVRDMLAALLPADDIPALFETLVNWGRNAELFEYDANADELGLWAGRDEREDAGAPPG
jgi:NitT/TauT family transport system ATP-binding protein